MWGYFIFCVVFCILKCLPDSYDGRKWLAKVKVNNSSQVISQAFLVRLDSAELTWLGNDLKAFVTCLWLYFIWFMFWLEFKDPVDLKQWSKSSSVIVKIAMYGIMARNQVIIHVALLWLVEISQSWIIFMVGISNYNFSIFIF